MTKEIIKPLADKKGYRPFLLDNGMNVLVISEPLVGPSGAMEIDGDTADEDSITSEEDKDSQCRLAAAALCVDVGSFSDPENFQGLAHFLEHMLFLGSEKYPTENHFDDFLQSHSGHSNACTEGEHTIYYFAVSQEGLKEALDIIASCLVNPLLLPNAVDREVNAVHSEYEDNLLEDSSRRLQLLNLMAKPDHPFRGFPFGNIKSLIDIPKSLGLDINRELQTFFQQHYWANRMYLAVQSHHSLDKMQSWITTSFSPVRSMPKITLPSVDIRWDFPFVKDAFAQLYRVSPARDMHELIITWALPSLLNKYTEKPHHYLSFIIGDEAAGSLISFLRKKRLALQLSAGNDESGDEHNRLWCKFSINIQLTDEGLAAYESVLRYTFAYIAMLRSIGPQDRIFEELKYINQFRFDYQDETEPVDNVNSICNFMKLYPIQHVLNGSFVFSDWRPESVESCLTLMEPSQCNIILSSQTFADKMENAAIEPWFKTKYLRQPLNSAWWSNIKPDEWSMFSVPAPNLYIPNDFTVKSLPDQPVVRISFSDETVGARLWYKSGSTNYSQPKACVSLLLFGDVFCNSRRNRVAIDIYLALLQLYLIEKLYPAGVAGLKCSIKLQEFSKFGISITFSGFSDKIAAFVDMVLSEIVNFSYTEDMFNIISAEVERECKNSCISPMDFGHQLRLATLINEHCPRFERIAPHSPGCYLSMCDFEGFLKEWRESRCCLLDCLISGNLDEKEAITIFSSCKAIFQPHLCSVSDAQAKELKLVQKNQCAVLASCAQQDKTMILCAQRFSVKDDDNFAVVTYYQVGPGDFKSFCIAQLYELIASEPCFNVLRTQKQLGYNCYLQMHNTAGTLGVSVTVQSSHTSFSTKMVDDEIDKFFTSMVEHIKSLSSHDFDEQVASLVELKLAPFGSLKDENRYYWSEICNRGALMFDRREKEADLLSTLIQSEVINFAERLVACRQKLSVHVIDPSEAVESFVTVNGISRNECLSHHQHLVLCKAKAYENMSEGSFLTDLASFKKSLACYPHVEF